MDKESVRIGVVGVLGEAFVGFEAGGLVRLVRDVTDRHKVSLGKEIPKAAIRQSNVDVDKKLKQVEKKRSNRKKKKKKTRAILSAYPKYIDRDRSIERSKVFLRRSISEKTDQGFLTHSSHNTLFLFSRHCHRSSRNNQQCRSLQLIMLLPKRYRETRSVDVVVAFSMI